MVIGPLGGRAFPRRITIYSAQYKVTARYNPKGTISCRIRPLKESKPAKPWELLLFLAISVAFTGYLTWSNLETLGSWRRPSTANLLQYGLVISIEFLVLVVIQRRCIATWHAAEHMAIQTYEATGSTRLGDIRRGDRIAVRCGSGLLLPIMLLGCASLAFSIGLRASNATEHLQWLVMLAWQWWVAIMLCWMINSFRSWGSMPVFRTVSHLLQYYVSTKDPGEAELHTAQRAIQELVAAHANQPTP